MKRYIRMLGLLKPIQTPYLSTLTSSSRQRKQQQESEYLLRLVCLNMVMRVIDSASESEVMTPMTRSDETGRHRLIMEPVEINATCRFESCLQWVAYSSTLVGIGVGQQP